MCKVLSLSPRYSCPFMLVKHTYWISLQPVNNCLVLHWETSLPARGWSLAVIMLWEDSPWASDLSISAACSRTEITLDILAILRARKPDGESLQKKTSHVLVQSKLGVWFAIASALVSIRARLLVDINWHNKCCAWTLYSYHSYLCKHMGWYMYFVLL